MPKKFASDAHQQLENADRHGVLPRPSGAAALETAARDALNVRLGRILTDADWARSRQRLLEFAGILQLWEHRARAHQKEGSEPEQLPKAA